MMYLVLVKSSTLWIILVGITKGVYSRNNHHLFHRPTDVGEQTRAFVASPLSAGAVSRVGHQRSSIQNFDFDERHDRSGTDAFAWDRYKEKDVIPMWIADMEFQTAPAVLKALRSRVEHGIFGYTLPAEGARAAVVRYYKERHGVQLEDDRSIMFTPGTVQSMMGTCAMLPANKSVMVTTPSYPPFFDSPKNTGRGVVTIPLDRAGGRWTYDWNAMEAAMVEHTDVALFMLCNPYNPVGRVFTEEELRRLGEFCERHDLIIVSDEIHCDLILDKELRHLSMLAVDDGRFADRTIVLNAPSKTYNVAGLCCAYVIIPNRRLYVGFRRAVRGWISQNSPLGYEACTAAYNEGETWRQAMLEYLRGNRDYLYAFIQERLPELRIDPMEATYLAWVDIRQLGWEKPALEFEKAGVGLTAGESFHGEGYVRINFACPRATLEEALQRIEKAVVEGYRQGQRAGDS